MQVLHFFVLFQEGAFQFTLPVDLRVVEFSAQVLVLFSGLVCICLHLRLSILNFLQSICQLDFKLLFLGLHVVEVITFVFEPVFQLIDDALEFFDSSF